MSRSARRNSAGLAIAAIVMTFLMVGCARVGEGQASAFMGTGSDTIQYDTVAHAVSIDLRLTLDEGSAALELRSPSGMVVWREEFEAADGLPPVVFDHSGGFTDVAGRWRLIVEKTDARGRIDVYFRDEP